MSLKQPSTYKIDTVNGNVICRHRDLSCCLDCVQMHEEIVEIYGLHYWVSDPQERQTYTKV